MNKTVYKKMTRCYTLGGSSNIPYQELSGCYDKVVVPRSPNALSSDRALSL